MVTSRLVAHVVPGSSETMFSTLLKDRRWQTLGLYICVWMMLAPKPLYFLCFMRTRRGGACSTQIWIWIGGYWLSAVFGYCQAILVDNPVPAHVQLFEYGNVKCLSSIFSPQVRNGLLGTAKQRLSYGKLWSMGQVVSYVGGEKGVPQLSVLQTHISTSPSAKL